MPGSTRIAALRYALTATGLIFIFGIVTLAQVWPSGWRWGMGQSHYWPMILAVYATLGVFLVRASRDPLRNRSLIWFTIWWGDVPALLLIAAALTILTRQASSEGRLADLGTRRVA